MTAERIFTVLNLVAVAAWLPLVVLPRTRWATRVVPMVVPLLFAVAYVALLAASLGRSDGGFSSLAAVRALFDDDLALLAGWTHYLAFDLFVGGWTVRDAQRRGIPHLLVVPALVSTFLLGPAGLLLYLTIRQLAADGTGGAVHASPTTDPGGRMARDDDRNLARSTRNPDVKDQDTGGRDHDRDRYRDGDDVREPLSGDDRMGTSPDTKNEARGDARENVGNTAHDQVGRSDS